MKRKKEKLKPVVVDFTKLKEIGWPFCRAETDRGESDGRYPKSFKLGSHLNSRRLWRVSDVLDFFEKHGIHVKEDWYNDNDAQ
jgi:hypothetical protein